MEQLTQDQWFERACDPLTEEEVFRCEHCGDRATHYCAVFICSHSLCRAAEYARDLYNLAVEDYHLAGAELAAADFFGTDRTARASVLMWTRYDRFNNAVERATHREKPIRECCWQEEGF